jgi:hypothetical protein
MKSSKFKWLLAISYISFMLIAISFAHSWHYIDFNNDSKATPIITEVELSNIQGYKIVHVLGEGCGCSEFVSEYLYERGKKLGLNELVYFIGNEESLKSNLRVKGFDTSFHTFESIRKKKLKTEGVPYFQIYNTENKLVYSGGYDNKMITKYTKFKDLEILKSLQIYKTTDKSLPVYGCATSKNIQELIDPFQLKY